MKKIITLALFLCTIVSIAQKKETSVIKEKQDTIKSNWKKDGLFTTLFNQSAYNKDWQAGGINNIATNFKVNYDINYAKGDVVWDNKIILAYGLAKTGDNNKFQKTNDRILITSLWGKKIKKNWYYSAYANLRSQFANGYTDKTETKRISSFFSPTYLQVGPGFLWKKSDNFRVNITVASARAIFVNSVFTKDGSSFGVDKGKTFRFELGTNVATYYKFNAFKNVSFENLLNLYANYLEDFGNIDVNYTLNIAMKVNDFLSTNIVIQTIYDDNTVKAVQVREVLGIGFNYKF